MTIKEVENQTGLARSNVRFYEKEKLIAPSRNESNGYREYSEKDVEDIKKIAWLRTLGIPVEDIRKVIEGKMPLREAVEKQDKVLEEQIAASGQAKAMCEKVLSAKNISYEKLQIEQYVAELPDYWSHNQPVFKLDSVSFLFIWRSFMTWAAVTFSCLLIGILFYKKLPPEIPVQWSKGAVSALVDKKFIFAYPVACMAIRCLVRPCIYAKLQWNNHNLEMVTEYLTNFLCFIALSVEVFSILFVYGVVENVVVVLIMDTAVLIGTLVVGLIKMDLKEKG